MNTISAAPSDRRMPAFGHSALQGVLAGVVPLVVLILGASATMLLCLLILGLTGSVAFATRQTIMVLVLAAGLLASALVYAVASVRVLRRIHQWQRKGEARQAAGALWALAITACVVLLPVVIALLLPTPAP